MDGALIVQVPSATVVIDTALTAMLGLKCAAGTITGPCDPLRQGDSAVVMTIMDLEGEVPIGITAVDEADQGHPTVDMADIEAGAPKVRIWTTRPAYQFREEIRETFLMFKYS